LLSILSRAAKPILFIKAESLNNNSTAEDIVSGDLG
jgi:hypothetical protein